MLQAIADTSLLRDQKYCWSPSVRWEQTEQEIRIEIFAYSDFVLDIFPKFYFLTQKGITLDKLYQQFPSIDRKKLQSFIQDLIKKKILISSIMTPQEIFFPQRNLFKNEYSENIIFDAAELSKFKEKQLNRNCLPNAACKVLLKNDINYPQYISERKSYRNFDTQKLISFDTFSKFISILKQRKTDDHICYFYASAGGLYPIDIYVFIKENRIANITAGLYYYNPIENSLNLINGDYRIPEDVHYFQNKSIFNESAFSVFLIYNAETTMPKYGGMGYFYAGIDAGIIVGALTQVAELCNIGLCSIGEMNFKKIENYFNLNENQVFLHLIEGGLKTNQPIVI